MLTKIVNWSVSRHHIEFLIGDQVLPYNMTIFQAIKQYALVSHIVQHSWLHLQGYTNADNPFGDQHLLETFVWHKVILKLNLIC